MVSELCWASSVTKQPASPQEGAVTVMTLTKTSSSRRIQDTVLSPQALNDVPHGSTPAAKLASPNNLGKKRLSDGFSSFEKNARQGSYWEEVEANTTLEGSVKQPLPRCVDLLARIRELNLEIASLQHLKHVAAQKEDIAIQATSAKLEQERHAVIVEEHARRAGLTLAWQEVSAALSLSMVLSRPDLSVCAAGGGGTTLRTVSNLSHSVNRTRSAPLSENSALCTTTTSPLTACFDVFSTLSAETSSPTEETPSKETQLVKNITDLTAMLCDSERRVSQLEVDLLEKDARLERLESIVTKDRQIFTTAMEKKHVRVQPVSDLERSNTYEYPSCLSPTTAPIPSYSAAVASPLSITHSSPSSTFKPVKAPKKVKLPACLELCTSETSGVTTLFLAPRERWTGAGPVWEAGNRKLKINASGHWALVIGGDEVLRTRRVTRGTLPLSLPAVGWVGYSSTGGELVTVSVSITKRSRRGSARGRSRSRSVGGGSARQVSPSSDALSPLEGGAMARRGASVRTSSPISEVLSAADMPVPSPSPALARVW